VLVGKPFGSGFRRTIAGQVVDVSPHDHYLETFLRFGMAGVVASILLLVLAWRGAAALTPASGALGSILTAIIVFGITYRWSPVEAILLGTILGLSAVQRPQSPLTGAVPSLAGSRA
jgi:O-antigen ligase